ncbi:MAG: DNA polymerase III subunit gamma/tau, partial [Erysipelotrichaceae bacterium]|nr:DNA polymerase III subunit gamma/tau [Erysipelotrichaceae bacterium]
YRTYRPAKFSEVVGQEYIIKTLVNAIRNKKIAHAYLFAGPRGTGKTTIAKLFAKAINCDHFQGESCDNCPNCRAYLEGNHPDIIELDAASNNGVENVREIIEQVPYAPLLGKYKVYIIDEVHMLSASAFNALLKTLEEPPAHVIFILATTDPQKVIPTVLSRCQRYNFSKISTYEIKKRTCEILKAENIPYEEKAVEEIARMAEGGMRDALSILEQCLAYSPDSLKLEDVEQIFGLTSVPEEVELFLQIHRNRVSEVIRRLREMYGGGIDTKRLAIDLLEIVKDTLIYSDQGREDLLTRINAIEAQEILSEVGIRQLLADVDDLEDLLGRERQNQNFLVYLELCLIKMSANKGPETFVKETVPASVPTPAKEEEPVMEKEIPEEEPVTSFVVEPEMDFLLAILLDASRDLKINDQIIYNKLDLYAYEPEKRRFYQLLINTELFASNKDAIIVCGNHTQAADINTKANNEDLYRFFNEEFGIDKMIYAIDEDQKKKLIEMYKTVPAQERNKPVYVEKYKIDAPREKTQEEKLIDLFGEGVKIED